MTQLVKNLRQGERQSEPKPIARPKKLLKPGQSMLNDIKLTSQQEQGGKHQQNPGDHSRSTEQPAKARIQPA